MNGVRENWDLTPIIEVPVKGGGVIKVKSPDDPDVSRRKEHDVLLLIRNLFSHEV